MLASGLPDRGSVVGLVEGMTVPLLAASWTSLRDQLAYADQYAMLESAPPPTTPPPAQSSSETEEGIAGIALLIREVIKRGRQEGRPPDALAELLAVVTGGRASRVVMRDARDWARRYLTTDSSVLAYRRVPDADPCHFCAMLASRGFVYRDQRFTHVNRERRDTRVLEGWHDSCACTSQPVFVGRDEPTLDAVTREAQRVYESSTAKFNGEDKARAFRRAWENRRQR